MRALSIRHKLLRLEILEPRCLLSDTALWISEFMADNVSGLLDGNNNHADWIELYNPNATAVSLQGWALTDDAGDLQKWPLPNVSLAAGAYLVVIASGEITVDYRDSKGYYHTNFKLSASGEYLALVRPDVTIAHQYAPTYPAQAPDVSYGVSTTLVGSKAGASAFVPTGANGGSTLGDTWKGAAANEPFDQSEWTGGTVGVGFGSVGTGTIGLNLQSQMLNVNPSAFVRVPFLVTDPSALTSLNLTMRYNDGFVAWINGQQVAAANNPSPLAWDSAATGSHDPSQAVVFTIPVTPGLLQAGWNILSVQGLNVTAGDGNFLVQPQLDAGAMTLGAGQYFTTPTPKSANSAGKTNLGPWITRATNKVDRPAGGAGSAPLVITALVEPSLRPIGTVQLAYRVMFNSETLLNMYDDGPNGGHGDAAAGDQLYSALVPTTGLSAGQMLRWRVIAKDVSNNQSTAPAFLNASDSDQYYGTVTLDGVQTALPVYHLFVQNYHFPSDGSYTTVDTDAGARADFFYNDELYDNVLVRIKGFSTRYYFKRSHHIDFNAEHPFQWKDGETPVHSLALNAEFVDPSYLRQFLSTWIQNDVGTGASPDFPVRLQMNGEFWQLAFHILPLHGDLLRQLGWDPDGALYKQVGQVTTGGSGEKQTRTWEDNSDFLAMAAAVSESRTLEQRRQALLDLFDLPQVINYMAMTRITQEADDVWTNMAVYRDSNGTGRWRIIPYDLNFSFGQNFHDNGSHKDNVVFATDDSCKSHPLYGGATVTTSFTGAYNRIYDAVIQAPETRAMLLRRIRTLMDEYVGPPGTPYGSRKIEQKLDELVALITTEANMDRDNWGWPPTSGPYGMGSVPFSQGINELKSLYLEPRRTHLYVTHSVNNTAKPIGITNSSNAGIPAQQGTRLNVVFGAYEASPAGGNQDQEWLSLVNRTAIAVDLSGWRLCGGVDYSLEPGTVLAPGGTLYVAPSLVAFQQRSVSPKGGQGLFVQGGYEGHLSTFGETVELRDDTNTLVATLTTPSQPSAAQQSLRITEIMYHPQDPTQGSTYKNDDFEFVELKNIGSSRLDLTGVKFNEGIYFSFSGSALTTLAPGGRVLVVGNAGAFQSRYGHAFDSLIAGQFTAPPGELSPSGLDNAGEKITLADASGEPILSLTYNDSWYTQSDGSGNSLVIRDATASDRDLWDQREGWAASRRPGGSPGADEAAPEYAPDVIVVNEVLAHRTDEPNALGDWVEFYNATDAAIPLAGWYLSNDDHGLQKYQIAAGVTIAAHGYLAFNWRDHFGSAANPGCLTPFTFGELGGAVYLTSASDGLLTGYQVSEKFGASDTGVTFGRILKSTGGKDFVATTAPSYELPNQPPAVGPVVISEVCYRPTAGGDSYVELKNAGGQDAGLFDAAHPQNTWHLTQGIDFTFPAGSKVPANGYALVVNIDPGRFRSKYSVSAAVPIFGPFDKKLNNDGDTIELDRPGSPQPDGRVPYYRVDQLTYADDNSWPRAADGYGASLARKSAAAYGDDAANWEAGHPTPGATNTAYDSTPPSGPTSLTAGKVGSTVTLAWTAATDAESGVAYYKIYEGGNFVRCVAASPYSVPNAFDMIGYAEISAVNGDGMEGPRVMSTPYLRTVAMTAAVATSAATVKVTFSEPLNRDTAQDKSHYLVTQAAITEAVLLPDHQSVQLKLSSNMVAGKSYTVTAGGTITLSGNPVATTMNSKSYTYTPPVAAPTYVLREYWTGIPGAQVSDLTSSAAYPDNPAGTSDLTGGYLETATSWSDNYGTRLRGYITAPSTGDYAFWIAAYDSGELWLSTDETAGSRRKIAWVSQGTESRQWNDPQEPNQQSSPVHLEAGRRYYLEALQKGGIGNDNLAVGWQLPDGTQERPVSTTRVRAYNPAAEYTLTVAATEPVATEAPGKGTFAITRTGNTVDPLTVYYAVTGTASTADVQEPLSGTLVIPAGAASATLDVTPVPDAMQEGGETVKLALLPGKNYTVAVPGSATITVLDAGAEIRSRRVFYNNSAFDGRNAAANAQDDGAIATDKGPLLLGQAATIDNYTSYSRGINGIMVDLANTGTSFTASDFEFRAGNDNNPATWPLVTATPTVSSRMLDGVLTRVTLIFPDNAVQNQWLQVRVLATVHTLLSGADVFYFGNAIGETGDHTAAPNANAEVDASDEADTRAGATTTSPAAITDLYDLNRDRRVNATDELLARANYRVGADALQLINLAVASGGMNVEPSVNSNEESTVSSVTHLAPSLAATAVSAAAPITPASLALEASATIATKASGAAGAPLEARRCLAVMQDTIRLTAAPRGTTSLRPSAHDAAIIAVAQMPTSTYLLPAPPLRRYDEGDCRLPARSGATHQPALGRKTPRISPVALAFRGALEAVGLKVSTSDVKMEVLELHAEVEDEMNGLLSTTRIAQKRSKKSDSVAPGVPSPLAGTLTLFDT